MRDTRTLAPCAARPEHRIEWPRVLIFGGRPHPGYGTGIFLSALFQGWPQDRIAAIDFERSGIPPLSAADRHVYVLGREDLALRRPVASLNPLPPSRWSPGPPTPAGPSPVARRPSCRAGRLLSSALVRAFAAVAGSADPLYAPQVSPDLLEWVRAVRPTVLYGLFSDCRSAVMLDALRAASGLPLVLHIMDDWIGTLYTRGRARMLVRPRYSRVVALLTSHAVLRLAICDAMAAEYTDRYSQAWLSLPMPVDLGSYRTLSSRARQRCAAGGSFRIRYGGRLGWGIRSSVVSVARAVDRLRRTGRDVTLDVYSDNRHLVARECAGCQGVRLLPNLPFEAVPVDQAASDLLLVCYDFDATAKRMARYSMPGKMAECMASGTPILVYGPPGLPAVEYALRSEWAAVLTNPDPAALDSALAELMDDDALRQRLAAQAHARAFREHDSRAVSTRFCAMLQNALNGSPHATTR